jgi:hypothetical protein
VIIANHGGTGRSFFAGIVLYVIGLGFTVGFSFFCSGFWHQLNTDINEVIKQEGFPTSFGQFHDITPMFMLESMVSLCFLASIGCSLYFLRKIVSAFGQLAPFRKLAKLLTPKTISRQFGDFNIPKWAKRSLSLVSQICQCFRTVIGFLANTFLVRFVRHFGVHILVFMVAAVVCAIVAFLFFGLLFLLPDSEDAGLEQVVFILRMIFDVSSSVLCGLFACIGIVLCILQVLLPFFQDLDDLSRDKLVLEF